MSGFTHLMFITRVGLLASTCNAVSVATRNPLHQEVRRAHTHLQRAKQLHGLAAPAHRQTIGIDVDDAIEIAEKIQI